MCTIRDRIYGVCFSVPENRDTGLTRDKICPFAFLIRWPGKIGNALLLVCYDLWQTFQAVAVQ